MIAFSVVSRLHSPADRCVGGRRAGHVDRERHVDHRGGVGAARRRSSRCCGRSSVRTPAPSARPCSRRGRIFLRTSPIETLIRTSAGALALTPNRTYGVDFAPWPFASGVPIVSEPDCCWGGLHDGKASGEPCCFVRRSAGLVSGYERDPQGRCAARRGGSFGWIGCQSGELPEEAICVRLLPSTSWTYTPVQDELGAVRGPVATLRSGARCSRCRRDGSCRTRYQHGGGGALPDSRPKRSRRATSRGKSRRRRWCR